MRINLLHNFIFFPHQNGVGLVAVLAGEWRVDCQADTVTHYCEENEEIKRFPFNQRYAVFPGKDQISQATQANIIRP